MHKLWAVFHHLPRECSVCFNKVVLKNQSTLKYIKWKFQTPFSSLDSTVSAVGTEAPSSRSFRIQTQMHIHLLVDRFL